MSDSKQKVTGIGGIFFKSKNPKELSKWYAENLGVPMDKDGYVVFQWKDGQEPDKPGSTVWAPFDDDTDYFNPSKARHMINYRVVDLDAMLEQLRAAGVEVDEKVEDMEGFGRFGWAMDPEGNKFELWEPPAGM